MTTIQDAEKLKRKIAELESCFQDFEDIKRIPPLSYDERMNSLKKLKTMADRLIKTYKTLKGFDGRDELWDDGHTLKLTGFKHGLRVHPKPINVKDYLKYHEIEIEDSMLVNDPDYGWDFILIPFKSTSNLEKALRTELPRLPATCPGGIYVFEGRLSKLRE
jgi:hypothetical protein